MKAVVFLACIILLARASPPNNGVRPSAKLFHFDSDRFFLLPGLTFRSFPDHHLNAFDDSFAEEVHAALNEPRLQPTLDLFPLSNDLIRPSVSFDRDLEPTDFSKIEKSNGNLQTERKYSWNELETYERENMDTLTLGIEEPTNDQVAHSNQYIGEGSSTLHDDKEESTAENMHDADVQEQGFRHFFLRIVIVSAVEDAQLIPQRSRNGRILSQKRTAILARNKRRSNPDMREALNMRQKEYRSGRRALKRTLLGTNYPDQPFGALVGLFSHQ